MRCARVVSPDLAVYQLVQQAKVALSFHSFVRADSHCLLFFSQSKGDTVGRTYGFSELKGAASGVWLHCCYLLGYVSARSSFFFALFSCSLSELSRAPLPRCSTCLKIRSPPSLRCPAPSATTLLDPNLVKNALSYPSV